MEFPSGADRLAGASFGMALSSDVVDFGARNDIDTVTPLSIYAPGNATDEEGFAVFSGWPGQDFDNTEVMQRTFVNKYEANTRGHTGRWMVVDYRIKTNETLSAPVYVIQMMDIDLETATDDLFTYVPERNMTVIHQGTTFIGLALFHFGSSYYYGHNAGEMNPNVFDGEPTIFAHMSSPNNQTTSATAQNWYMDIVAKVPADEAFVGAHVSFAVVVGATLAELEGALFDARNALEGGWSSAPIATWERGTISRTAHYSGPLFPPVGLIWEHRYRTTTGLWTLWSALPWSALPGRNVSSSLSTSPIIPDWGSIEFQIGSRSPWGFMDRPVVITTKADNKGPDTDLTISEGPDPGILFADASPDDRGGSGAQMVLMSVDRGPYSATSHVEITREGTGISVSAYSVDASGNIGPARSVNGLTNDGTPPHIFSLVLDPADVDEDTEGKVNVLLSAIDEVSGLNMSSARFRWGFGSPQSSWTPMTFDSGTFSGSIDADWDASQESDIKVTAEVKDQTGNRAEASLSEGIEGYNDPPYFTMSIVADEWEAEGIGMVFEGFDPDGDEVSFTFDHRLGAGAVWQDVPSDLISSSDQRHFFFELPELVYEGSIEIRAFASDGKTSVELPARSANIDLKPPTLSVSGHPGSMWTGTGPTIIASSTDGGSGPASTWFVVKGASSERRIDSEVINDMEDGIWDITAFSSDVVGNQVKKELGVVRLDREPVVIGDISISPPAGPKIGDDLFVQFEFSDNTSLRDGITQDLQDEMSLFRVSILKGDDDIPADTVSVDPLSPWTMKAWFRNPFDSGGAFTVRIAASDLAGNPSELCTYFNIEEELPECPLNLTYPETVRTGQGFEISLRWDGPVELEARYPGTDRTWIITQYRKEGDVRSFRLPGLYSGEVRFRVFYGPPEGKSVNMTCPGEGWLTIGTTGYEDTDLDGLCDEWERNFGLDPDRADEVKVDRDRDGLDLLEEMMNLTDPSKKDTDGDSMDDEWEASHGTLPFRSDAKEDPDHDGWSNIKEMVEGTDPRDPQEHPVELPVTPWYYIVLILLVLMGILGYFVAQLFRRKRLEKDLDEFDEAVSWDDEEEDRSRSKSGKL